MSGWGGEIGWGKDMLKSQDKTCISRWPTTEHERTWSIITIDVASGLSRGVAVSSRRIQLLGMLQHFAFFRSGSLDGRAQSMLLRSIVLCYVMILSGVGFCEHSLPAKPCEASKTAKGMPILRHRWRGLAS